MFKLQIGYFICGCITGLLLLFNFLTSLPDGKLHIVFCDVGQGDAMYVRFPDGRDMLIDGGPNASVLSCLSRHMPFWDRSIDMVIMTHPENDHLQGLISVIERYQVSYFVRSDITNGSDGFATLTKYLKDRAIHERLVAAGEEIDVGGSHILVMWPSMDQIASMKPRVALQGTSVLGASIGNLNDGSLVLWMRYGAFDAWLSGDADSHVESKYRRTSLADRSIEVLKVPHHGSKSGMSKDYLDWLKPQLAVISVGRNTYGHPSKEMLSLLADKGLRLLRTDIAGDIEIISDGVGWDVNVTESLPKMSQ